MAIKLLEELRSITFSPLKEPKDEKSVTQNSLRIALRITLGTGGIAIISAVFNRYVTYQRAKTIASYLLPASSTSCATSAVIAAFIFYKMSTNRSDEKTINRSIWLFEGVFTVVTGGLGVGFGFANYFLDSNHPARSITRHWVQFGVSEWTAFFLAQYHNSQLKKIGHFDQPKKNVNAT